MRLQRRQDIVQILIEKGSISEDQAIEIRNASRDTNMSLEQLAVDVAGVAAPDVLAAKAEQLNVSYVDFNATQPDESALNVMPRDMAEKYKAVPVRRNEDGTLLVAMVDPTDIEAVDAINQATQLRIEPALALEGSIDAIIQNVYGQTSASEIDSIVSDVGRRSTLVDETEGRSVSELAESVKGSDVDVAAQAPIIKLTNLMIRNAVTQTASDIHVEPQRRNVRVRYRVDGILHEEVILPKHVHAPLISRLKIMSDMDIAERRVPQDGRIHVVSEGKPYDIRVSSVPTTMGEKIVMRILDQSNTMVGLDRLGFLPDTLARLERLTNQPNGIVLSTGPTGHGKTTTQYSVLNKLNTTEVNIMTIEDPVEYQLPGIAQVAVNVKAGLTFATALRSFLRQDPDIMMVGEIRDLETADIAIHASLTGHLVLSTLHTNDAPSSMTRLIDMGVEPFLCAASVIGVLAQRLGRRICSNCKEPYEPHDEALIGLQYDPAVHGETTFYHGVGCEQCRYTGYKGRLGIFELMEMNEEIAELVARGAPLGDVREAARANGMTLLREDGLTKVIMGWTTAEEVVRRVATAGQYA